MTKTRAQLLAELRLALSATADGERAGELIANVETFLDWDTNYGVGSLTLFTRHDIDEYLLRWCPRKLSFPPESWLDVVAGLAAYLEFLGSSGHWRGPATGATALAAHARQQTQAFLDAMADPSNFGMAKSLFMGPAFAGADIDFEDPTALQAAMDRFNSLSFEERTALTDPGMHRSLADFQRAEREARASFNMPPVRLPSADAVFTSAVASPLRRGLEGLREYLGDKGVALTATDNLKLADCRTLVERLETGDQFEYGPPGGARQARSMNQLPTLAYLFDIALEAGATRKAKGRLLAVKRWQSNPLAAARTLAGLAIDFDDHDGGWFDQLSISMADGLPYLLAPAMGFGITLPIDDMLPLAVGAAEGMSRPNWVTETSLPRIVERSLVSLMERMALAGVVTFADRGVTTTPFGVQFMVERMRDMGFVVPELPSLAGLSAVEVLASVTDATVFAPQPAWADWQPGWTEERKSHELVEALLAVPPAARTTHERVAAFALLSVPSSAAAEPELRRLIGGPYAVYAVTALAERDLPMPDDIDNSPEVLDGLIDLSAVLLAWLDEQYIELLIDGPAAVVPGTRELIEDTSPAILDELARMPITEVGDVLAAIGAAYPNKAIAKLARTARHRWQSRRGR